MSDPAARPIDDPLVELNAALAEGRPPPLAWVVRHGAAGARDPLAGAWEASAAWVLMLTSIGWDPYTEIAPTSNPRVVRARVAQLKACVAAELAGACDPDAQWWKKPRACARCAAAIRTEVPAPDLTFAELLREACAADEEEPPP